MGWTEEQLQAINKRGANILVSAAAGSGKTSVLVERIITKVIEDKVDVDKILVVTFTSAAASEMKQRLLKALYKKIDEKPDDAYLQRQISLLNRANISTIHSFCLNMIKNNFYLLEMPANFRIGDTAEIEILKQEVIESIFEEKYENNDKEFLDLIRKYTTYSDDQNLKDLIIKIYEYSRCTPNPKKWIRESAEDFNFEEIDFKEPDINLILNEGYESENQKILLGEKINKTRNLELQYEEENLECYAGINGNLEMYIDEELAYIKIFDEETYNVRVQDFDYNVFDDKFPIFLKSKYKSQEIIEKDYNILYFSDLHLILVQPKAEYIAKIAIIFNKKCEEYIENKINNKEML